MNIFLSILHIVLQVLLGLFGIGIVIFLHELGHFVASRIFKIDVEILSYGYGPKLLAFKGKETEFRLSLIPFGGYCRMKGSMDLKKALHNKEKTISDAEPGSFFAARPYKRFLVYLAGPLSNFIIAFLLLSIASAIPVERLSDPAVLINTSTYPLLFENSVNNTLIQNGDIALSSSDYVFSDYQDFERYISDHMGEEIPIRLSRGGVEISSVLVPMENEDGETEYGISNWQEPVIGRTESALFQDGDRILDVNGVSVQNTYDFYNVALTSETLNLSLLRHGRVVKVTIPSSETLPFAWASSIKKAKDSNNPIKYGMKRTFSLIKDTFQALGAILTFNFSDIREILTGPVNASRTFGRISTIAFSTSFSSGIRTLIYLMAIASVSVCVVNLLFIPTFDGGQMLLTVCEMIHKKPLSPKAYIILQIVGLVIGYGLVVFMYALDLYELIF